MRRPFRCHKTLLVLYAIFNGNWRCHLSQNQPEFNEACKDDSGCNRFQHDSGFQCSVCAEDKSGNGRCLNTFIKNGWYDKQCKLPSSCELECVYGQCYFKDKSYIPTCFCPIGHGGENCARTNLGSFGLRMLQWRRENIFTKPGEITRFYYKSVGDPDAIDTGLYRAFVTEFGHSFSPGNLHLTPPSACTEREGIWCTDDYADLQFPFLLPNNHLGVTVLKMKDKLNGYLTTVKGKFKTKSLKVHVPYIFNVFVDYQLNPFLKCIPLIRLTNCAVRASESQNFVFHPNEEVIINYNVKYLEDGAYLSTAKENRQACSAADTIWQWTWSRYGIIYGLENTWEEKTESGNLFKLHPFTLSYGRYRVNLRIKRIGSAATNENFDECYFQVKPRPLKAIIDGGEVTKTIIKDAGIFLTARQSSDPNKPADNQGSLVIRWSCECLTKDIPNCEKTCKMNTKWTSVNAGFFLPGTKLQYNAEYKFTLTVDSTIRYGDSKIAPQYSYVTIKVANESVKVVTNYYMKCIQNCLKTATLSNEILFLKAQISISGKLSHEINESMEFDWIYSKEGESVFNSMDSIKLANLPSNMLAIKEDSFEMGVTYTIRLKGHKSEAIAAEYSFTTVSMAYEGNCTVEPQSGIKGLTIFDIKCIGFEGFIFEFYDKSEEDLAENTAFNGRMLGTSEFLGSLNGVRITRGNIEVYIVQKDSKLFVKKNLKVELSPWSVTDGVLEDVIKGLASTVRLDDMSTTMNYVSFIPDILPASAHKSRILDLLLEPISKVRLYAYAGVKLSTSTMKLVLQVLNKPSPISVSFGLIHKTLAITMRQADIIGKAAKQRHTTQWMSTQEIKLVATALLECLNSVLRSQSASTAGLSEERMGFDSLFMLRKNAQTIGEILDKFKDILCYIQAAGLPPAKLTILDKSLQIWALGNDKDYTVSEMLKHDDSLPFGVSPDLLKTYSADSKYETDLFFQTAQIDTNIFSWSKSDVKSKLVSLSVAVRKKGEDLKKIEVLSSPIHVRVAMENNLTNTVVKGSALQLDPTLDPTYLDVELKIHRIDTPPKGFVTIRFLFPPTAESIRVLVKEDYRPVYELMTNSHETVIINSSNPVYPIKHRSIDLPMFLYMGILPGKNVAINKTVDYEFEVTQNLCQLWIEGQWSSIGCGVSEATTDNETVCVCNHLSIFAAAFPVPPQSIDPIDDAKLFLTVLENPLVVVFVIILFIIYLMLVLWGRYKDGIDRFKGKVVVLEDNFPEDEFPYMVAVHTSARFNAGTTAHVCMKIMGKELNSRAHILSSERRKVLTRNSDDWFMLYTSKPLGEIYGVHIWHDNYGTSAEWYCDRIAVYDLTERTESIFIVEQWLALRQGDFPEAHLVKASETDMLNIKRMFLDNSILGFRDSHTFLSVFVRHPRSEVTRVQRISILMCSVMVAMLCSIMFFFPEDDDESRTDDYNYDVGMREIIISIETLVVTAILTLAVLIAFKRSYKVRYEQLPMTLQYREDNISDSLAKESLYLEPKINQASSGPDKSFYENYVRYVSKYLKGHPLAPVSLWEDENKLKIRKVWYTIAWLSCIIIILGTAFFVMLYGLKLGFIQSQKWLTSLVMTIGEDIFVMGPGRIILMAILLSMAFQLSTKVNLHGIGVKDAMLARPKNELYYLNILLAKRSHPMYAPLSSSARVALLKKKEINRRWWNLLDFVNSVCFVVVVSSVIYRLWTSHYHGVNHLHNVFSESHKKQFGTVDIDKINNMSLVENYLEITLIEVTFNLLWYNGQPHKKNSDIEGIQKYWIKDGQHKPISSLYIRQVRVVPNDCRRLYINMTKCLLPWSLGNKDENVYGEKWVPAMYLDTTKKDSPWDFTDRSTALWWTNQRFYGNWVKDSHRLPLQ